MRIRSLGGLLTLGAGLIVTSATRGLDNPSTPLPEQRYEEARLLMQRGRYLEAAEAYRSVAESAETPPALRSQALFTSGLMQENARNYERAVETYEEVQRRFPDSPFAARAAQTLAALEQGGPRWIEFRRRQDAAWDVLRPAQELAERQGLGVARPGLEQAAALFEAILRDFGDHPKAKDVALTLGSIHMTLLQFAAARTDYERAVAIARQGKAVENSGPGADSIIQNAEEFLGEAIRAWRRQWLTRGAWGVLATIAVGLLAVRPWRPAGWPRARLGVSLTLATLLLALVAVGASYCIKHFVDAYSPIESWTAGLLVAVPGVTGIVVALGFAGGLRRTLRWHERPATGVAAALGAIAALAVATCLVNAFALFPVLDSAL